MTSNFKTFFKSYFTILFSLFAIALYAQERTIRGKVVNERGAPLIGVSIIAQKYLDSHSLDNKYQRNEGTVSNIDGEFELTTPVDLLLLSYIGYNPQTVDLNDGDDFYSIRLLPKNYLFDAPTIVGHLLHPTITSPISRKQIRQLDPITINEALSSQAGLQFQSGSINTNRLSIRGVGARSPFATSGIKAYIGEIPIHDLLGESNIEDIGTQFFDQIEVTKGHSGPGYSNGIGGAIRMNIKYMMYDKVKYLDGIRFMSPDYEEKKRKDLLLETAHSIGAYGLLKNEFSGEYKTERKDGEDFIVRAKLGLISSDGYRSNNTVDRKNFQSSFYHQVKRKAFLTGILSHTFLDAQIPSSLSLEDYNTHPRKAAFIWGQSRGFERYNKTISGLTYTDKSSRFDEVSVSGYLHRLSSIELRPFNTLDTRAYTIGSRIKISETLKEGNLYRVKWTGGLDAQLDDFNIDILETLDSTPGGILSSNNDLISQYNHYQKINFSSDEYRLEGGFDLGWRKVPSINGQGKGHLTFAPHVDLRKNIFPENTAYLRAGKGYLYPSPDQYIDANGNFNNELNPSNGCNLELGLKNTGNYIGSPIKYHVAIYHMWLQNQLTSTQNADGNTVWNNGGRVNLGGIEVGVSYTKVLSENQQFQIEINHTENIHRFGKFDVQGENISGNYWTGSPKRSNFTNIQYQYNGVALGIRGHYVGEMPLDDANTNFNEDYFLLKSRLGYQHNFWSEQFTFTCFLEVDNLTDVQYSPMVQVNAFKAASGPRYYYPGLPRNVIGNVRFAYRFTTFKKQHRSM